MRGHHITPRIGLVVLALMSPLALVSMAGQAAGYSPGCGQIPIVYGIPPWGFHTSNDPKCKVGTVGRATLFASYNGVRS
jgi:hypothetical protein